MNVQTIIKNQLLEWGFEIEGEGTPEFVVKKENKTTELILWPDKVWVIPDYGKTVKAVNRQLALFEESIKMQMDDGASYNDAACDALNAAAGAFHFVDPDTDTKENVHINIADPNFFDKLKSTIDEALYDISID